MSDTSSQILWSQFTNEVAAKMGAGSTEAAIQVLPSAQLLYGKTADDIKKAIDQFAAVLPQWGAIYNPSPSTLIQAYQIVMTQIKETKTNGTSIKKEYEKEQKKLSKMMGQASKYKTGKLEAYIKASAIYSKAGLTPPTFKEWFKDNGAQEFNAMLQEQTHQYQKVKMLLKAEGINSPYIEALGKLNDELSKIKDSVAPETIINPGADLLADWKTSPTNPGSITFDNSSSHYDYTKTVWHSQTGTKLFGFISIGHRDVTHVQENILSTSINYNLEMDFAAQASITVTQEDWFNDSILRDYKAGPWISGSQFDMGLAHPYGQDGILPLVVTKFYVIMNPTITISMDKKDFSSVYDQLNGNFKNGVNLGPFAFGGSDNHNSSIHKMTDSSESIQKVKLEDTSNIPQVIAVVNQLMP